MTFDAINPITGLPKEYANSAEWLRDVDAATVKPVEEQREVKTFADASKRLLEETGLDLRSADEQKAAADAGFIEKKVAEGVAAALARQTQTATQTPKPSTQAHSAAGPRYRFYDGQKDCGCKAHQQPPQAAVHSRVGRGPVMPAQAVAGKGEIEHQGTVYKIYRVRSP